MKDDLRQFKRADAPSLVAEEKRLTKRLYELKRAYDNEGDPEVAAGIYAELVETQNKRREISRLLDRAVAR